MKPNVFLSSIAITIACLSGYLLSSISDSADGITFAIGGGLCSGLTLIPAIGIEYTRPRIGLNIRILSLLSFIVLLAINICFVAFDGSMKFYIISIGLAASIYVAVAYAINRIKQL